MADKMEINKGTMSGNDEALAMTDNLKPVRDKVTIDGNEAAAYVAFRQMK
jgi:hypothetical protein